jgi:hypothetical protein
VPRIVTACTTLVTKADSTDGRFVYCFHSLAAAGVNPIKAKQGELDFVGDQMKKKWPLWEDTSFVFETLRRSNDPRVRPWMLPIFKEHLAAVATKPPVGWKAENWLRWRRSALAIIGAHGTKADLPFLDEVQAATKDKRVLSWIKAARTAIEKR